MILLVLISPIRSLINKTEISRKYKGNHTTSLSLNIYIAKQILEGKCAQLFCFSLFFFLKNIYTGKNEVQKSCLSPSVNKKPSVSEYQYMYYYKLTQSY